MSVSQDAVRCSAAVQSAPACAAASCSWAPPEPLRQSAFARRISGAQAPEIVAMSSWLHGHDLVVPTADGEMHEHDHGEQMDATMPGMLTDAEMGELEAAQGARFDRLSLEGMIGHHEGAIQMADQVATHGTDIIVSEMAADVAVGQSAEIERMRELLHELARSN